MTSAEGQKSTDAPKWGFQLVVREPPWRRINGEAPQVWTMPEPVGEVALTVRPEARLEECDELTFRGRGFGSAEAALEAGKRFRGWLLLGSAHHVLGFDPGDDNQRSWFGDDVQDRWRDNPDLERVFLVDDVHGLHVFQDESGTPVRFTLTAAPVVQMPDAIVHDAVLTYASAGVVSDRYE